MKLELLGGTRCEVINKEGELALHPTSSRLDQALELLVAHKSASVWGV